MTASDAPKPTYKVIAISLYVSAMADLDAKVDRSTAARPQV